MTYYEHLMFSLCFGVCAGVVITGYWIMFKGLFKFIKRKISDRKTSFIYSTHLKLIPKTFPLTSSSKTLMTKTAMSLTQQETPKLKMNSGPISSWIFSSKNSPQSTRTWVKCLSFCTKIIQAEKFWK